MLIEPSEFEGRMQQISQEIQAAKLVVTNRKWWAWKSSNQSNITNATYVTIQFDSNLTAMNCETGFSNYGYLVPERGIYLVDGVIQWYNTTALHEYMAKIYIDAAGVNYGYAHSSDAGVGYLTSKVFAFLPLDVGEVVYLKAYHTDGTNTPDVFGGDAYRTHMAIHLLSRRCD